MMTAPIDTPNMDQAVSYTHLVQGRYRVQSYKVHVQEAVPQDEWYVVENTHEAIVDRETFDKVQSGLLYTSRCV